VLYDTADGIARITLNRPVVLNAINKNVLRLLDAALDRVERDASVRAVVLSGAGRAFSAGGDMWASLYPDDDPAPDGLDVLLRIWELDRPVVAAVRGHALGMGCELAGVCDLTIAAEDARFGEVQIRQGFGPPVLITPFLAGQKQAKEVLLLGEILTALDAQRVGLVNRVVPNDELEAAATAVAAKLAALPPSAVRLNKRLVNRVYERMGMLETLRYRDDDALKALFDTEDAVAAERRRIQNEQGWAAFKQERDRGYQS
jgi:enoyl-CoA hydratase/carnithine racemase